VTIESQGILEVLDQVIAASRESRREDGPLTQVLSPCIWIGSNSIYQALVNTRVESLLIVYKPVKHDCSAAAHESTIYS
jgi:hypothetical protein